MTFDDDEECGNDDGNGSEDEDGSDEEGGSDDGAPSFGAARDHVVGHLVDFVRALRERGVTVPADGSLVAARALAAVGLDDRDRVHVALRSALASSEADLDTVDALFPAFWRQLRDVDDHHVLDPAPEMGEPDSSVGSFPEAIASEPFRNDDGRESSGDGIEEGDEAESADVSPIEDAVDGDEDDAPSDGTDVSVYSPVGGRERVTGRPAATAAVPDVDAAVDRLVDALAGLPGRRWTGSGTDRIDVRRALRRGVATGGVPLPLPRRGRDRDAANVVLLVDVSRSVLDTVERGFLLRFAAALSRACRSARIFFFDTSIREVSSAFDGGDGQAGDPSVALERAEAEWGGGTRIGRSIGQLRDTDPAAIDRMTTVLVVSDGLEVGEIDDLERSMAWLSNRAGAVLWLNPLAVSPAYEPTCRGMARSLPYLDGLFAFVGPDDVDEIARQLDRRGLGGPIGYRHDGRRRRAARN